MYGIGRAGAAEMAYAPDGADAGLCHGAGISAGMDRRGCVCRKGI